jgi:NAD(P)-dependent dehydrogenase (short-subunit alcohol dehydrogenase family)
MSRHDLFALTGRVAVITGGAGRLGVQHARAIAGAGGIPVLVDIAGDLARQSGEELAREFNVPALGVEADISDPRSVARCKDQVLGRYSRIDILINNAAHNPKFEHNGSAGFSRLENFELSQWHADIAVGLTGAFLCSQAMGSQMARQGHGVIVNVASDLALIGPDQRIYRSEGVPDHLQPVKPITYSVVKSGLIGLTRYLATYWANAGVRVNAISPGGVQDGQTESFIAKLANLIPMGRMATLTEYQGAILFLCSDASSYMTGANLVIDGGRTSW